MQDSHIYIIARLTDTKIGDVKHFVTSYNLSTEKLHQEILNSVEERKRFTSALSGYRHNLDREEIIKKYQ